MLPIVSLIAAVTGAAALCPDGSGIAGTVSLGPLCPVERPGMTCSKPVAATLVITRDDGTRAAQVRSADDGTFHVCLPPGSYDISPQPLKKDAVLPRGASQHVEIKAHELARVVVQYDTGIR